MFCTKCGKEIQEGVAFCSNCGTPVRTKGKEKTKVKIPVTVIAVTSILIIIGIVIAILVVGKNDGSPVANTDGNEMLSASHSQEESDTLENIEVSETQEETIEVEKPAYLSQLVEYETAQYSYSGVNILDLSVRNYQPNQKQEGMDWDSTLFYILEDISDSSNEDGQIAKYNMSIYNFINAQSGNEIQCFVYTHAENGQINKIVTVEPQDNGCSISDYYYDNGKVNFVFTRTVDVYTPTYATIDKVGTRYYFNNDVMVRYRTIEVPRQLVQQTLNPTNTWYPNTSYFTMDSEDMANYDAVEYQVLNEAYNVYNAVQNQQNVYEMKGYVYSKEGAPLANVSMAIIDPTDNTVLYSGETAEDGSYHIYVSLDNRNCYLQVYLEGYLPVYIYDVELNSNLLGNFASCIYLSEIDSVQTETKLYLYNSLELTEDENAAPMQNAQVVIRSGLNAKDGEIVVTGNTSETGVFETTLTPGAYTAEYALDGYATTYENFYVIADVCVVKGYTVTAISDNTEKIVLCWDSDIDLDLVLYTPEKSVYGDMNYINIRQPIDKYNNYLVADASTSRCEVLNISNQLDGQYKIFVNDYTSYQSGTYDSNALATSGARIYVYTSEGLIAVYHIDPSKTGIVWNVCEKGISYYPCSIVSSNLDNYTLINKELITTNVLLEIYREFLRGNVTAEYEGMPVTYSSLLWDIYQPTYEIVYQTFSLTDYDKNNIPELQVWFDDINFVQKIYTIELQNGGLKITGKIEYDYNENVSIYRNGANKVYRSYGNEVGIYFYDEEGKQLACYEWMSSDSENKDNIQSYTENSYGLGWKYVYITNEDICTYESFFDFVNSFETEQCGEEVEFFEVEESSIQNNLKWN